MKCEANPPFMPGRGGFQQWNLEDTRHGIATESPIAEVVSRDPDVFVLGPEGNLVKLGDIWGLFVAHFWKILYKAILLTMDSLDSVISLQFILFCHLLCGTLALCGISTLQDVVML